MPPLMSSVKQTLSEAASRAAGVSCMYKLAGVEAWEGMLGSYDIQTLVRQPPIERGIYRWRHSLLFHPIRGATKLRSGAVSSRRRMQQRSPSLRLDLEVQRMCCRVRFVRPRPTTCGRLLPSFVYRVRPSVSHVVCANTGNSFLSFTDACHSPIHSTPGKGITSITRPSLACLDHLVLHVPIITLGTCFFFLFFFIIIIVALEIICTNTL